MRAALPCLIQSSLIIWFGNYVSSRRNILQLQQFEDYPRFIGRNPEEFTILSYTVILESLMQRPLHFIRSRDLRCIEALKR